VFTALAQDAGERRLPHLERLVSQIQSNLLQKKNNHRINVSSLADFEVSLERAASVLGQKDGPQSPEPDKDEP
jgi:hypothetical protein